MNTKETLTALKEKAVALQKKFQSDDPKAKQLADEILAAIVKMEAHEASKIVPFDENSNIPVAKPVRDLRRMTGSPFTPRRYDGKK